MKWNKPARRRRTSVYYVNRRNSRATYTVWNAPSSQPDVVTCHLYYDNRLVINQDMAPQTTRIGTAELDFKPADVTLATLWTART